MHDVSRNVAEYLEALKNSERFGSQVAHHEVIAGRAPRWGEPRRPWPASIRNLLEARGVERLYAHQTEATDLVRSGRNVVVATPTASGKTYVYNLPVVERLLADPDAKALYLFPLKALAQDQLKTLNELLDLLPPDRRPTAAIYDGDTPDGQRRKIRKDPPGVLLTNPEMLHLSILPYHASWASFLAGLTYVVVDEAHTYRGVMGSHMAHVFRRLRRLCEYYGARPAFIFCSATVGNPVALCQGLTGLPVELVDQSGAPSGTRHVVFLNPHDGAAQAAIQLLRSALARELRTIVYCQSRRMTELIAMWAAEKAGPYRDRISAYRSGFLPEERREIEARLSSGDLLAVITTSALELGIDIGDLDLCLLVGYPGTIMSTWQRGGRVGRGRQDSAMALIAQEDALDQYFMRHPRDFFERPPESAVLNPANPVILGRHLVCAAAELPLSPTEAYLAEPAAHKRVQELLYSGALLQSGDGLTIYSSRKRPQREVDLRGAGGVYHIEDSRTGESIGLADERRAFRENHPGAVYLHRGRTYVVDRLDLADRTVKAAPARVGYFTRARGHKETEIIEVQAGRACWGGRVFHGRLKVTETVTGYEKRSVSGQKLLNIVPLELPSLSYETDGIWFEIPKGLQDLAQSRFMHFMGGIHALEHAAIGILPLLVMTDRNDLGGISTPFHPQVAEEGSPAVFIYDGAPGGVGLTRAAFERADEVLASALKVVEGCACDLGCPSCVHSPKCGSGNRPIDKEAALFLLRALRDQNFTADRPLDLPARLLPLPGRDADAALPVSPVSAALGRAWGVTAQGAAPSVNVPEARPAALGAEIPQAEPPAGAAVFSVSSNALGQAPQAAPRVLKPLPRYAVLDVETRRSAEEVGGWGRADRMGVSVAVVYDSVRDDFLDYPEEAVPALAERLSGFELVVGFNSLRFDYKVLRGCCPAFDFARLPTLDLLDEVKRRLSYRLSLDSLARATLGASKTASGLQALQWWKEGKTDEIAAYCRQDVAVTRDLYLFGREKGYLLFTNKAGQAVRLPTCW